MKVCGKITEQTVKEFFIMLMAMFMMESGLMIKLMVLEYTDMLTVQCMRVSGLKINSTEKELKLGQMEPSTRASIEMAKKMGKEH